MNAGALLARIDSFFGIQLHALEMQENIASRLTDPIPMKLGILVKTSGDRPHTPSVSHSSVRPALKMPFLCLADEADEDGFPFNLRLRTTNMIGCQDDRTAVHLPRPLRSCSYGSDLKPLESMYHYYC